MQAGSLSCAACPLEHAHAGQRTWPLTSWIELLTLLTPGAEPATEPATSVAAMLCDLRLFMANRPARYAPRHDLQTTLHRRSARQMGGGGPGDFPRRGLVARREALPASIENATVLMASPFDFGSSGSHTVATARHVAYLPHFSALRFSSLCIRLESWSVESCGCSLCPCRICSESNGAKERSTDEPRPEAQ